MKTRRLLAGPYLFWAVSFIIIPLLLIVYYGLTDTDGAFTLLNLAKMAEPENLKSLGLALLLSLVSTLICLILAYPLAMILSEKNLNQTSFIVLIFILPMWMNFLLRTLAWQTLLEKNGVINSILAFFHLYILKINKNHNHKLEQILIFHLLYFLKSPNSRCVYPRFLLNNQL